MVAVQGVGEFDCDLAVEAAALGRDAPGCGLPEASRNAVAPSQPGQTPIQLQGHGERLCAVVAI